jgi:hypothetical protein
MGINTQTASSSDEIIDIIDLSKIVQTSSQLELYHTDLTLKRNIIDHKYPDLP